MRTKKASVIFYHLILAIVRVNLKDNSFSGPFSIDDVKFVFFFKFHKICITSLLDAVCAIHGVKEVL